MNKFFLVLIMIIAAVNVQAQSTGDYQSKGNVTLSSATNWQRYNGSSWEDAKNAPTESDGVITISTNHQLVFDWNESRTINQLVINGTIDLKNNATLTITSSGTANDLTVNNNISIDGNLVLASGTKVIFNRNVTMTGQASLKFPFNGVTLDNKGTFTLNNRPVSFDANSNILNELNATFDMNAANPAFSGKFDNYGKLNVKSYFSITANSVLSNYKNSQFSTQDYPGTIDIYGTFNNSVNFEYAVLNIKSTGVYNSLDGAAIKIKDGGSITIEGLLKNTGTITYPNNWNNIVFGNNGVYEHAQNGGTIPLINNCASAGTVRISGVTTTSPTMPYIVNWPYPKQAAYYNFEWNCPNQTSDAQLDTTITVNNQLILNAGYITIGSNQQLIMAASANVSSVIAGSFVKTKANGVMRKYFASKGSFTYPLGDNANDGTYNPVTINFTAGTFSSSSYLDINTTSSKHPNNTSGTSYLNRYWTISPSDISSYSADASFTFASADLVGDASKMFLVRYYNNQWITYQHPMNNVLSITGLTTFGDFTGGLDGAMPIELQSFTYSVTGRDVNLKWVTSKEENNSGFDVERTISGKNEWTKIAFVKGNGNSSSPIEYKYSDNKLNTGIYEYRIKQIDYNGNYEYYKLSGIIDITLPVKYDLSQNYPNPFNPTTKIEYSITSNNFVKLSIYDITGKEVKVLVNEMKNAGYYTLEFNASGLSSGVYFYRLSTDNFSSVKRMVVLK